MTESITARFNYTGRKRIELSMASVRLEAEEDKLAVVLNVLDPDHFGSYVADAQVIVTLTRRTLVERIEFGPVSGLESPARRISELFTDPTGVGASVKVVSTGLGSKGLLLGASKKLSTSNPESNDESPLLLFQRSNLGARLWKLDFEDSVPTVLISASLNDWEGEVRDLRFQALVFPEITRQVAVWLTTEDEDDDSSAARNWRKFFARLGTPMPPLEPGDAKAVEDWAEQCANALASREHYTARFIGMEDEEI